MGYKNHWYVLLFLLAFGAATLSALGSVGASSSPVMEAMSSQGALAQTVENNCRFGVNNTTGEKALGLIDAMGAGVQLSFSVAPELGTADVPHYEMIRFRPVRDAMGFRTGDYLMYVPGSLGALEQTLLANPGRLWIVGNEVDRRTWQDDLMPDVYARAYHDTYQFIKSVDPTAQVAVSGLVLVSPNRLAYLDYVWDAFIDMYGYTMPVDVWTMHPYILPEMHGDGRWAEASVAVGTGCGGPNDQPVEPYCEAYLATGGGYILSSSNDPNSCAADDVYCYAEHDDVSIIEGQIRMMRDWMKEKGHQHKPLIITEFGTLYPFDDYDDPINPTTCYLQDEFGDCFTAARVVDMLNDGFDLVHTLTDVSTGLPADDYRLVQQIMWYGTNNYVSGSSNALLICEDGCSEPENWSLSPIGVGFQDYVMNQSLSVNLRSETDNVSMFSTQPTDVHLTARVFNNGSQRLLDSYTVTFYSNAALTNVIGSYTVADSTDGCVLDQHAGSVTWENRSPGFHRFWVKVDSGNAISESNEGDNVVQGTVLIGSERLFLSLARH